MVVERWELQNMIVSFLGNSIYTCLKKKCTIIEAFYITYFYVIWVTLFFCWLAKFVATSLELR